MIRVKCHHMTKYHATMGKTGDMLKVTRYVKKPLSHWLSRHQRMYIAMVDSNMIRTWYLQ